MSKTKPVGIVKTKMTPRPQLKKEEKRQGLTVWTRLAWSSQNSICLCLSGVEIKDAHHNAQGILLFGQWQSTNQIQLGCRPPLCRDKNVRRTVMV